MLRPIEGDIDDPRSCVGYPIREQVIFIKDRMQFLLNSIADIWQKFVGSLRVIIKSYGSDEVDTICSVFCGFGNRFLGFGTVEMIEV